MSSLTPGDPVTVKVDGKWVTAKYQSWNDRYGKANVEYEGRVYYRVLPGATEGPADPVVEIVPSRFSVLERFDFIETLVAMVGSGVSKALVITGSGGLGKTYTVTKTLDQLGVDPFVVKGFTTPKSLFRLLHEQNGRVIMFDDCDSIWGDERSVSLLKAALDSYETRVISWLTERPDPELPDRFEFTGRIIFVSNKHLHQLDQAVLSRCLFVDVSMTQMEKLERIRYIAKTFKHPSSAYERELAVAVIENNLNDIADLNIRTFLKVLDIQSSKNENWERVAEYMITTGV